MDQFRNRLKRLRIGAQPAGARKISVRDLVPLATATGATGLPAARGVPSIELTDTDPRDFIGGKHRDNMLEHIKLFYNRESCSSSSLQRRRDTQNALPTRIPPMALTRHPSGGKTRTLKEIGLALRQERIFSLFISFNDLTAYDAAKEHDRTWLQSLLLRIGWAAAKADVRRSVGEDFSRWLTEVEVTEDTICKWLGDAVCVLLVDELNKLIVGEGREEFPDEGKSVAAFLRTQFVDKHGRYLVFSSHFTETGSKLTVFMDSLSNRDVLRPLLPVIKSVDEAAAVSQEAASASKLSYLGLTPALVHKAFAVETQPVALCVNQIFDKLPKPLFTEATLRAVIMLALDGAEEYVLALGGWAAALDAFVVRPPHIGTPSYTWSPCFLAAACARLAASGELRKSLRQGLWRIASALQQLAETTEGSGVQWESVCAAALILRMMQSDVGDYSNLHPDAGAILPPAVFNGCAFGGAFRPTDPDGFMHALPTDRSPNIALLRRTVEDEISKPSYKEQGLDKGIMALFVQPAVSNFPWYDMFIFVCRDGQVVEIWGYQSKTGSSTPADAQTPVSKQVDKN
ncbi:unnamed protein product [Vitrella brassicaformis CCMP3155]|uniref:Uncharacterized protein n=1 Tax=Vitrella brassicaformis (strain CCMP3155) TaxID=1169540 RepID=A0A0G4FPK4_VITBC|nr:unnamed protein product [Vitrella brassicaformis CCMP3155]|eukprot:CEM16387.1 unnamed protein product [Vitrella brassicaformis CCMP3155]